MQEQERICAICGRKLEPLEVDQAGKIAWYACPLFSLDETDDANSHTVIPAPLGEEIEKELVESKR